MGQGFGIMTTQKTAPYGTWESPITTDLIVGQVVGLGGLAVDGDDIYWLESRPSEGGRSVLVRRNGGEAAVDLTPQPFNLRSRVHEYGGGAFAVDDGTVVFVNFADQRLYRIERGGAPAAMTPEAALRFADFVFDRARGRVICIREDHRADGEPVNSLVAVTLDGDAEGGAVLAEGHDFFAAPALSPDGTRLAWITWDHPNMPWDGSDLWLAEVADDGTLGTPEHIAGGPEESVQQPEWSPDGVLHFVSDRSGWWNLYRYDGGRAVPLCSKSAEFGLPLWQLGVKTYRFLADGSIGCVFIDNGQSSLAMLRDGNLATIETPFAGTNAPQSYDGRLALAVGYRDAATCLVVFDPKDGGVEELKRAASFDLGAGDVSVAQQVEFPTEGAKTSHAFFYPPANASHRAPDGEKPPLIVISHGGPTGATSDSLSLGIQFWTSRGFAVADVNYGGSTGYGRAYRERLDGTWGIVDVDDCVNAARYLADRGLADPDRLLIRGGSAGGYTTLSALTFRDAFKAGASHYGIGDLAALARDTHKFESRYLDRIIGPYPEAEAVYRERSPIHFTDRLDCPVIFFQGLDDKVVPPNQAEEMVAALKAKGLPVAYIPFEGEGHGFRKAENIKRALEAELYFYGRVFGFTPAGDIEPVEIHNL